MLFCNLHKLQTSLVSPICTDLFPKQMMGKLVMIFKKLWWWQTIEQNFMMLISVSFSVGQWWQICKAEFSAISGSTGANHESFPLINLFSIQTIFKLFYSGKILAKFSSAKRKEKKKGALKPCRSTRWRLKKLDLQPSEVHPKKTPNNINKSWSTRSDRASEDDYLHLSLISSRTEQMPRRTNVHRFHFPAKCRRETTWVREGGY